MAPGRKAPGREPKKLSTRLDSDPAPRTPSEKRTPNLVTPGPVRMDLVQKAARLMVGGKCEEARKTYLEAYRKTPAYQGVAQKAYLACMRVIWSKQAAAALIRGDCKKARELRLKALSKSWPNRERVAERYYQMCMWRQGRRRNRRP